MDDESQQYIDPEKKLLDDNATWEFIRWARQFWSKPIVVKVCRPFSRDWCTAHAVLVAAWISNVSCCNALCCVLSALSAASQVSGCGVLFAHTALARQHGLVRPNKVQLQHARQAVLSLSLADHAPSCLMLLLTRATDLQGILSPSDAIKAVDAKVDGIIVSNHGGRQLDYAPAVSCFLPIMCVHMVGC